MERIPRPNEIYQHFKGNLYKVITLAKHSESEEMMVVYQALYGKFDVYVRPLDSFMSKVDREKYPDAAAEYRFTLIPAVMGLETPQACEEKQCAEAAQTCEETKCDEILPIQEEARKVEISSQSNESIEKSDCPPKTPETEEDFEIDPAVMAFLDAETYKEKLDILIDAHERITDAMINTMSVSLDLEVAEGSTEERYWELKNCLLTLEKYEIDRLR